MRVWGRGSSSGNPLDFSGERSDLARGSFAARHFRDEPSGPGRVREDGTLANPRSESWRVMFGQCLSDLARNKRAGTETVQDEPRNKLRTEAPCLLKQAQGLGCRP